MREKYFAQMLLLLFLRCRQLGFGEMFSRLYEKLFFSCVLKAAHSKSR